MRLTRVYVDQGFDRGREFALPADTAAHVAKVLRARSGDPLVLFNGDGTEWSGEISAVRGSRVSVVAGEPRAIDRESPLALGLLQCVPRGDRMDLIVQKATELGVASIVPLLSQRSVVRLDAAQAEAKTLHWRAIAVSACEQCGRNRLPQIAAPRPLLDYLGASTAHGVRLVLEPEAGPQAPQLSAGAAIEIAVGPEGGFAAEELDAFRTAGFVPLRLGPRVLRTETAAIAAVAALQARYGDMA